MQSMTTGDPIDLRTLHGRSMVFSVVGDHLLGVLDDGMLCYLFTLPGQGWLQAERATA